MPHMDTRMEKDECGRVRTWGKFFLRSLSESLKDRPPSTSTAMDATMMCVDRRGKCKYYTNAAYAT